ncbi:class I SAM-dependent methyltransferase [Roseibium sp. FZY0029]|uniref:class I SAM-dependent methyltransferase n=1 Tax=Roseibium sp. FZY0029 TaxID=3116647 RepID=UPI002EB81CA7|nr:class I SAM-dependent methyltransferase [Roseibium sp. FZY0029]
MDATEVNRRDGASGLQAVIAGQFRRPHGLLGALAGWIMANRASNIARNHWTVDLMELAPGAEVLEIGCGPGSGIGAVLEKVPHSRVTGVDHSALMIARSARRHAAALKADRLDLWQGEVSSLPEGRRFDAVFSCNVLQFVEERTAFLEEVRRRLKPGGIIATTYQPRGQCASAAEGRVWISQFAEDLCTAGFQDVDVREKVFGAMPAFCALGSLEAQQKAGAAKCSG